MHRVHANGTVDAHSVKAVSLMPSEGALFLLPSDGRL